MDFYNYRIEYKSLYRPTYDNYTDRVRHETLYVCKYFTQNDTKAKMEEIKHNIREFNESCIQAYDIEMNYQNTKNFILPLSNYEYVGEHIDELIEYYGGNYIILHNQSVVGIFPKGKGYEAQEESTKYEDGFAFFVPTISSEPGADSVKLSE